MQKAEPQRGQHQPAQRQGGVQAESPQGEQIAQLEAMAEVSPQAGKLGKLAAMMDTSSAMTAQRKMIAAIHNSPRQVAQRKRLEGQFGVAQRMEDEKPLQPKSASESPAQLEQKPAAKPNNTGLPDNLKLGIENLSGISMDNVKVHYNSPQPAQLNALAYAQGTDIHVAPGQEEHLPHEAWHVVQQAQERVRPTMQMKGGVPVNDDQGLEREADLMGKKAVQREAMQNVKDAPSPAKSIESDPVFHSPISPQVRQLPQVSGWMNGGNVQRVAVVQMEKGDGDRLLNAAKEIARNLEEQLLAKNYTEALRHYAGLKNAAKDLNQRKALSSREDEVYNRHIDGNEKTTGVNQLLNRAIERFKEVAQPDCDTKVQEVMVFVEQQEAEYKTAFDQMLNDIVSGKKETSQSAKKKMAGAAAAFEKAVKEKGKILNGVGLYKIESERDEVVKYIIAKGREKPKIACPPLKVPSYRNWT